MIHVYVVRNGRFGHEFRAALLSSGLPICEHVLADGKPGCKLIVNDDGMRNRVVAILRERPVGDMLFDQMRPWITIIEQTLFDVFMSVRASVPSDKLSRVEILRILQVTHPE